LIQYVKNDKIEVDCLGRTILHYALSYNKIGNIHWLLDECEQFMDVKDIFQARPYAYILISEDFVPSKTFEQERQNLNYNIPLLLGKPILSVSLAIILHYGLRIKELQHFLRTALKLGGARRIDPDIVFCLRYRESLEPSVLGILLENNFELYLHAVRLNKFDCVLKTNCKYNLKNIFETSEEMRCRLLIRCIFDGETSQELVADLLAVLFDGSISDGIQIEIKEICKVRLEKFTYKRYRQLDSLCIILLFLEGLCSPHKSQIYIENREFIQEQLSKQKHSEFYKLCPKLLTTMINLKWNNGSSAFDQEFIYHIIKLNGLKSV